METEVKPIQGYGATKETGYQAGFTLPTVGKPITPELKTFNQQMVSAGQTPTVVSNRNTLTKVNEDTNKFNQLGQPYAQNQNQQSGGGLYGVDQQTINNFKQANPGLDFTPEEAEYAKQADLEQKSYYTPEAQTAMQGFDNLQKNSDDLTKQYMEQAKEKYRLLNEEARTTNARVENSVRGMLAMQGSNAAGSDSNSLLNQTILNGQRSLNKLANEEQGVYLEALKAQKDENYKLFSDKVKQLDVIRNAKINDAVKFNENVTKQAEKIQEEKRQIQKENVIADNVSRGVTDVATILANARAMGINVTAKEAQDTVAAITGLGGTGIIGEYNYYKSEAKKAGITPVDFSTYQNEDANRKAVAQGLGGVGLTGVKYNSAQSKYIDTVNEKISKNATYQTTNKMKTFIQNVQTALNQENGIGDIAAINQFQKIIDEGAVTRDQDVVLLQGAQSLASSLGLKIENIRNGDKLADGQRAQMRTLIDEIYKAQLEALDKDPYVATTKEALKRNGIAEEDTIISELGGFGNQTTDSLLNKEKNAEADFASLVNNPPEIQAEIKNRYNDLQTILGRPPTAAEYFEANPWDRPKKPVSVSVGPALTDTSKKIVGGINLNGYAVDPNQPKAVATIYNKVPTSGDPLDLTKFIKSISPKSPITGDDVLAAANTYQLDPAILIALMQHESLMGTSSVARANNNYGGITWSPTYARNNPGVRKGTPRPKNEGGNYVKFNTPLDGLMAQAKLLSNRKIA